MKCPICQFDNRAGAKFCKRCGARLELKCPSCGSPYEHDSVFCDACGQDLTANRATVPVDYSQPHTYTPKFLADKILTSRQSLEGERKLVTVLVADVAGYTAISEKLDPEEVHRIMDGCLKILMDEIHKYEGTIDRFTGDGVMALFGAPVAHEDHAQRACYAALGIQKALEPYADRIKKESKTDFKMRVGLNSGPVIVGAVGSDLRMDYAAVGDTINLASRIQALAHPGTILVTKDTHKMARDFFRFKALGKKAVKGREEAVEAYELLEATHVATRIEAAIVRGLTRFVGRDKEMAILKEAFDKAKSGSGQVVGMVGEAGVGKSRILLEMRRMLPRGEYSYLQGSCLHYGSSMSYLPFLDVLKSYFGIEEGDREDVIGKKMSERIAQLDDKLKDILPALQDVLSLKVEDESYVNLDAPAKRIKIFEAIRDLLVRESQNRPLVLAIEDLHWIDKTSEELLSYLVGFLANANILLLLLYRPEYTHQWSSKSYYRQIGVDQLSLASSAELVQSILEEGEVVPELRELILSRAAGNPLFMEEFTHTLLENGSIGKKNHQYVLTLKASEIQVPDTLQGIIAARMDRLDENMKRTMQVASVIGRDFAFRILQTITGMREELKSYLINLQGLEFIYEKSLFPELEYIFKHALIQEVAYNSLLIKRRKEIHERIGLAIEEIYPLRLEEFYEMLAYHYSKSDNLDKAFQYLRLSSIKVGARNALVESVRLGQEAIAVLNQLPQTDENKRKGIEMRLLLSGSALGSGLMTDALQMMEEGAKLAEDVGDNRSLADLYGTIGFYAAMQGNAVRGAEYAEKAYGAAEKTGEVIPIATNGFDLVIACVMKGAYAQVVQVAPHVLDLLEEEHLQKRSDLGKYFNVNLYSAIKSYYGYGLGLLGDLKNGLALCAEACRFSEEAGNVYSLGIAEGCLTLLLLAKGDGKDSMIHLEKCIRACEQGQLASILWACPACMGCAHYLVGELDAARQHFEKRLETYRSTQYPFLVSLAYCGLGLVCLDSGDVEAARSHIEESLKLARKQGERDQEGRSIIALGRVIGKADPSQSARAEGLILEGISILEELGLKPYQAEGYLRLGELYSDSGEREKALTTLRKAEAISREMGMDYFLVRADEALERLRA